MTYIDLFSGSGGFSLGFENKGFQNIFSIDIEPSFCETYKYNFPNHTLIEKDICQLSDEEIKTKILEVATIFISDALDKKLTAIY